MGEEALHDEVLVEHARQSPSDDLRAFEKLVQRHQGHIVANCRHLTGSGSDAEDLAQEVFVKAFYALRKFEGRAKFKTWIQKIKVNHCLNFIQKTKKKRHVNIAQPGLEGAEELRVPPQGETRLQQEDERSRIVNVLDCMADTLRVPLIMRDLDGLSYQEIADHLSVGLSAVKMRIKRARVEFKMLYAELDDTKEEMNGE